MDSEMVGALQELSDSDLMSMLSGDQFQNMVQLRGTLINHDDSTLPLDYNVLAGTGVPDALSDHLNALLELIDIYQDSEAPDITEVHSIGAWRKDMPPKYNSGKIEKSLDSADPGFGIGPGPPPQHSDDDSW